MTDTVRIFKGDTGARHMLLVTSNGYKDREGEFISEEALREYVDSRWEGDTFKADNVLLFWHQGPAIGEIVHADMAGPFLVEVARERKSGLPLVRHYIKAIWNYIEDHPDEVWGTSHGFGFTPADREQTADGPVYRRIRKFESSVLPLEWAANPLTFSGVVKMSKARDEKLDKIQPGLGDRIRAALGMVKEELDAEGVEHKAFDAEMTREDLVDVLTAATGNVLTAVEEAATKSTDDNDAPASIDLRQVVKDTLDGMLDVPTVAVETAEAILALDDEPADTEEPEHDHDHDHTPVEDASDKAMSAVAGLNEQLMADQETLIKELAEVVAALQPVASLPEAVKALSEAVAQQGAAVKEMQAEFAMRPRASRADSTVAEGELVEKAVSDAVVDNFIPRARA